MTSLAESTARCFALGGLDQVIIAMEEGYLFVSSVSDGSSLGVVAERRCDVGAVGYQMTVLVQRVGAALSPALVAELKQSVLQ
jgi:predicted regulator of Ras-like GTPase activity (Roadblock/LC7/MglB family)